MPIDVSPETEHNLKAMAQQRGLSIDLYLREVLEREAKAIDAIQSGEAKAAAFLAWADSFPDTPPLSDDAINRSSLYPDRW